MSSKTDESNLKKQDGLPAGAENCDHFSESPGVAGFNPSALENVLGSPGVKVDLPKGRHVEVPEFEMVDGPKILDYRVKQNLVKDCDLRRLLELGRSVLDGNPNLKYVEVPEFFELLDGTEVRIPLTRLISRFSMEDLKTLFFEVRATYCEGYQPMREEGQRFFEELKDAQDYARELSQKYNDDWVVEIHKGDEEFDF